MRPVSRLKRFASVVALAGLVAAMPASAGVIDFDGTNAPVLFSDTAPLNDLYAPLGVAFSGAGALGGSILHQASEFGFTARSGTDFLALNTEAGTAKTERIAFASAQNLVSLYAATSEQGTFTMTAFDGAGNLLAFASQVATREWQALTLSHAGIRSVEVSSTTWSWAMDDLQFDGTAEVFEPGGIALLGVGLLALAALRQRRQ